MPKQELIEEISISTPFSNNSQSFCNHVGLKCMYAQYAAAQCLAMVNFDVNNMLQHDFDFIPHSCLMLIQKMYIFMQRFHTSDQRLKPLHITNTPDILVTCGHCTTFFHFSCGNRNTKKQSNNTQDYIYSYHPCGQPNNNEKYGTNIHTIPSLHKYKFTINNRKL